MLQPVGIADMRLFRSIEFSFSLHNGDGCEALVAERDCGSVWNWAMDKPAVWAYHENVHDSTRRSTNLAILAQLPTEGGSTPCETGRMVNQPT